MIDHKTKCIFIHLQRTGGTAIEKLFIKNDMWLSGQPHHKHLLASQAKKLYKDYWNDYFKFAFVRDPWSRTVSMLQYEHQFKVSKKNGKICNLNEYINQHSIENTNILLENDYRFSIRKDLYNKNKHIENQVYLNVLDEEIDFIGKYESIEKDVKYILERNNLKCELGTFFKTPTISYEDYFSEEAKQQITDLYKNDIDFFNYSFGDGKLLTRY